MSFNKLILSITLGLSFHNATICMENQTKLEEQLKISAADMSFCIYNFVRGSDNTQKYDSKEMESLGLWLTAQRNITSLEGEWDTKVNNLIVHVASCRCHCLANKASSAVCNVVKEIAKALQPGQDCSQLLVERAQETVTITAREWKEEQSKKDISHWYTD